ncbi:BlaI/MecI/CopY family transcriptional regulator [Lewinella sp. W8]|uniref:BlaI/MecI/CopY family transcriptional regulator n=1 Tax=Lewinella sp. W8 TaxID=2528208 RepID=UPI00106789B8|nr:BlaI/MecI/CopY family transcriptional regulator [Lewinella sp. W8]MTB51451.1 BlaI/MecI/CopY family transcriptional regulator [Lewinella sp. W8]
MPKQQPTQPTASELDVLQLLWDRGPLPVKEVHAALSQERDIVYTTVLKTMQVMFERGFLTRESAGRKHIYAAAIAKEDTQNSLLDTFLNKTFGGSAKALAMRALGNYQTSQQDIDELKALIEKLENKDQ